MKITCNFCGDSVEVSGSRRKDRPFYCSRPCGQRARANQKIERSCLLCGELFLGNYQAAVCPAPHEAACAACGEKFSVMSRYRPKQLSSPRLYCSFACGRNRAPELSSPCALCGELFLKKSPNSKVCSKPHELPCSLCGESFDAPLRYKLHRVVAGVGLFCSARCSRSGHSRFEEDFSRLLEGFGQHYERRDRVVIAPLELDFLLPRHRLAFEVNDFFSHSRHRDDEPFAFGGFKKGPSYHANKTARAAAAGVKLIHVWQDEIYSSNLIDSLEMLIRQLPKRD